MTKLYRLGERLFRLDISAWRENRRSGKLLRYYMKPADDNRNRLARWIDFYGTLLLTIIVTFLIMYSAFDEPRLAALFSIPLIAGEILLAFRIKVRRKNDRLLHKKIWQAGASALNKIQGIDSREEFSELVGEVLGKLEYFSDVHTVQNQSPENNNIPLRAVCNGVPVAVGCEIARNEKNEIEAEQVALYVQGMEKIGLNSGILVAGGTFSEEARQVALRASKKYTIRLIDAIKLVELARQAGHEIFPAEGISYGQSEKHTTRHMRRKLLASAVSGRKRGKGYLTASGVMFAMYLLFKAINPYSAMYLAFAGLNLALALYCMWTAREKELLAPLETIRPRS